MKRLLLILAVLAFSGAASAQAYKWVDKDGKVRYGDTPPPDATKVTRLKGPSGAPAATAPATDGKKGAASKDKALSPEAAFKKRQQERQEQEQKASQERAEADQKRAGCQQAQTSLRQLQSGQRMSTVNAAGERVFIDDEARAKEIERAQKSVTEWCK